MYEGRFKSGNLYFYCSVVGIIGLVRLFEYIDC